MNYQEWLGSVSESITKDSLWSFETYRKALFLSDLAWLDCEKLSSDALGRGTAWQLIDSAGSIAANIEEGFGRGFGKDYARFLRIALGSARESRGWYYRGRHAFNPDVVEHRMKLLDEIIAGLVSAANTQRQSKS
jgi:four helix bundle protein